VLNGAFYSLSYDLLGDLTPISAVAAVPIVLYARASLAAKDLKELISWLRGEPGPGFFLKECHAMRGKVLGPEHPATIRVCERLARLSSADAIHECFADPCP
jgi:hypothetical protein